MAAINTEKLSTNNLILVLLLVSLLAVGVSVLVSKSLITTIVRDTNVAKKKIATDKVLSNDVDAAPKLVSAYQGLGSVSTLLTDALPTDVDFPSILVTLDNMANVAGVKVTSVGPAVADTSSTPAAVPSTDASLAPTPQTYLFSVTASGTYDKIVKLMGNIEKSARPFRIVDAQFTGSGSALNVTLNITTYYQDKAVLPFSTEIVK